ncbi:hypothetical protein QWY82_19265 [Simiduia curdlanivorans]|uniref:Transmembrane protein n=1 Tax=Simiduia curdlanivorans TaxID=1492769 RepID=A0ABV8V5D2_9GAMM|nr:hypothetical protein [Simiduia curdlanivorans]MDN3640947.1 hypothetical protein [Simiduia curdlanivorans]
MNIVPKICLVLIASSLAILFASMGYWLRLDGSEFQLAQKIAAISSTVQAGVEYHEPTMVPGDDGVTEVRAIAIALASAVLLSVFSFVVATASRVKYGQYRLYLPLAFCSLILAVGIIYVGLRAGIQFSV